MTTDSVLTVMSSSVVRKHISAILNDGDFALDTPRMLTAKETAKQVLQLSSSSLTNNTAFDLFSTALVEKLQVSTSSFTSRARKKLWTKFHQVRCGEVAALWKDLFVKLCVKKESASDPLFEQYVNEKVLEWTIKEKIDTSPALSEPDELTMDELNTLRYVAGYVPFKLKKRFKKSSHPFKVEFLSCLDTMNNDDGSGSTHDDVDSFETYTKKWISIINRGGLFQINHDVFVFFHSIEFEVRRHLQLLLLQQSLLSKDDIMDEVLNDLDVQQHWSSIATQADVDEDAAQQLLKEIVQLWLTIRGYSASGEFVENYRKCNDKGTKKSVGLRKGLKRKKLDTGAEQLQDKK